jgi:adenine deaminase
MADALNHSPLRDRAVRAARGLAPFDVLLTGARVADMATGELRAADLGLVEPLIASVHAAGHRADAAIRHHLPGRILAPGLIDTHMHVESSMVTPRRYAETVLPQGTTTVCWDPHELGNVAGLDGVRWATAASRGLPLRTLVLAPSCVPSAPGLERAGASFGPDDMAEMLRWPEIAGVAEVMDMRGVLERSALMRGIVGAGLASGKLVCGHARGLSGGELQGFAAAGIGSDHEITSGADLLEKLRAGLTVELRGSHDYILPEAVAALNALPHYPQTLTLCTDDVFPDKLVARGGMIDLLRRLVRHARRGDGVRRWHPRGRGGTHGGGAARGRHARAARQHEAGAAVPGGFPHRRARHQRAAAHRLPAALHPLGRDQRAGARRLRGAAAGGDDAGGDAPARAGGATSGSRRAGRLGRLARRAGHHRRT